MGGRERRRQETLCSGGKPIVTPFVPLHHRNPIKSSVHGSVVLISPKLFQMSSPFRTGL